MHALRSALAFLAATAIVGLGCSSNAAHGGGSPCATDGDCASGACLDLAVFSGGDGGLTCRSAGKACSKTCAADSDCTSLGANFKCFQGCGSTMTCGATL